MSRNLLIISALFCCCLMKITKGDSKALELPPFVTFPGTDPSIHYILGSKRVPNVDRIAQQLCQHLAGKDATLAVMSDKMTRDYIACKLSAMESSGLAFPKDFWVNARTNKMDSVQIDPVTDLDLDGEKCVIMSNYNHLTGRFDGYDFNFYAKRCDEERPVLCQVITDWSSADSLHLVLGALLSVTSSALLFTCYLLATKKRIVMRRPVSQLSPPTGVYQEIPRLKTMPSIYESCGGDEIECPSDCVIISETIARGRYETWRKGTAKNMRTASDETHVLVKNLPDTLTPFVCKTFYDELRAVRQIENHNSIMRLIGCCLLEECPMLIYQCSAPQTLYSYLHIMRANAEPSKHRLVSFSRDVASALRYLHDRAMLHPDLRTETIWVCDDVTCKLTGFAGATEAREKVRHDMLKKVAPIRWMAPETVESGHVTWESNVWTFGVILWEIFSLGGVPYTGVEDCHVAPIIRSPKDLGQPPHCPQEIHALIIRCRMLSARRRPIMAEVEEALIKLSKKYAPSPSDQTLYAEIPC